MTNKNSVPKDVMAMCEEVVRGYERRKKVYENRRLDIIYRGGGAMSDYIGGTKSTGVSDTTATKSERLEALEDSLDVRLMRAVEQSLSAVGSDVSRDSRERLRRAFLLNCENGREFPYELLNVDEFSRTDFYRRKKRFIAGVSEVLGLN